MREIFLDVLNAGIAAGWIAAAIIALRLILKRVPGYIYCILWNIVLIRLILPVKGIFPRTRFSFIPSDMPVSLRNCMLRKIKAKYKGRCTVQR